MIDSTTDYRNNPQGIVNIMQAVLPNLLAALLLLHAAFGCCWHHTHHYLGCEGTSQTAATPVACCQHDCDETQQDRPLEPCRCNVECHGVCTYLPTQKVFIDGPQLVIPFDGVACLFSSTQANLAAAANGEAVCDPVSSEPRLRIHLLHQIMLI